MPDTEPRKTIREHVNGSNKAVTMWVGAFPVTVVLTAIISVAVVVKGEPKQDEAIAKQEKALTALRDEQITIRLDISNTRNDVNYTNKAIDRLAKQMEGQMTLVTTQMAAHTKAVQDTAVAVAKLEGRINEMDH